VVAPRSPARSSAGSPPSRCGARCRTWTWRASNLGGSAGGESPAGHRGHGPPPLGQARWRDPVRAHGWPFFFKQSSGPRPGPGGRPGWTAAAGARVPCPHRRRTLRPRRARRRSGSLQAPGKGRRRNLPVPSLACGRGCTSREVSCSRRRPLRGWDPPGPWVKAATSMRLLRRSQARALHWDGPFPAGRRRLAFRPRDQGETSDEQTRARKSGKERWGAAAPPGSNPGAA